MNPIQRHGRDYLRAVSQSFFFNDGRVGAAFLALLGAFSPQAFASAAAASLVGYAHSARALTPRALQSTGLITINGLFFGLAMAGLFRPSIPYWVFLGLGALAIPPLTKAAHEVLQHWKLSPLVAPYLLAVWAVWLCRGGAALGAPQPLEWVDDPVFAATIGSAWVSIAHLAWASFHSMARLVFLDNAAFGILMLAAITLFDPRRGAGFLVGTTIANLVAALLDVDPAAWQHGLYGYSAGLVGLGIASLPERHAMRTIVFYSATSAVATLALAELLGGARGLPLLSLPYVLTFWLALLSRTPRVSVSWAPQSLTRGFGAGAGAAGVAAAVAPSRQAAEEPARAA